jgi:hypothetical protein
VHGRVDVHVGDLAHVQLLLMPKDLEVVVAGLAVPVSAA